MRRLGLVFMGTPDFAVPVLEALLDAGHRILCVYTQPPRRAGRGRKPRASPVRLAAERRGLTVRTPETLRDPAEAERFAALRADAAVVAAYGLLLPSAILSRPRLGCLNVHASLLPRLRGAAPVERAIMAGEAETGVTIVQMDEGLDTGAILLQERVPVPEDATAGSLKETLSRVGARLMVAALAGLDEGRLAPSPQPAEGVTYAPKIAPAEARLDWRLPAPELARRVRSLAPRPGAWFLCGADRVRVLAAAATRGAAGTAPGRVLDASLTVACGEGALRLLTVQRAGRAAMKTETFLRGHPIRRGERLPMPGEPK